MARFFPRRNRRGSRAVVLNRSKLCVLSSRSKSGDPPCSATSRARHRKDGSMNTESSEPRTADRRRLERAIVLELLSEEDEQRRWSRAELGDSLGIGADELEAALTGLLQTGVLNLLDDLLTPSAAARRLDQLELIGI
jgi:hypothetical protein